MSPIKSVLDLWSNAPCKECRRKRECYRGLCKACRHDKSCRELVEAGVPSMTARQLVGLMKKGRTQGKTVQEIEALIAFVHPRLMENIAVAENGTVLKLRNEKYAWLQGSGWYDKNGRAKKLFRS